MADSNSTTLTAFGAAAGVSGDLDAPDQNGADSLGDGGGRWTRPVGATAAAGCGGVLGTVVSHRASLLGITCNWAAPGAARDQ